MIHVIHRCLLLITMAMVLAGAPTVSIAECEDEETGKKDADGSKFHVEERNGQKVYVIDKVVKVCGKVPRPLVAYVLQARTINYQWETLKQDFLPKIIESVRRAPF